MGALSSIMMTGPVMMFQCSNLVDLREFDDAHHVYTDWASILSTPSPPSFRSTIVPF